MTGWRICFPLIVLAFTVSAWAADLPDSKDPPGMKRYEGSEIIGYRAPRFEEFVLPLGTPTSFAPPAYEKGLPVEGLISRYTYLAPVGRTPAELFRNYKTEFGRLGLTTLYEKGPEQRGWFGPTLERIADEDQLGQILPYNEAQERVIVGKSKDAQPTYYYVFVTAYRDGVIPQRLEGAVAKGQGLVELIVITPEKLSERMTFVNAEEMSQSLADNGRVILEGLYFDTDKDTVRPDSQPLIEEIAKLMKGNPQLKVRVVGHTDNQGATDHNLDLSRRRAASVAGELTSTHAIGNDRLDPYGCGPYSPVATNDSEEGRARNRRVELVAW
jgi:outer membrane protein OmpA-like peptidoglycan-associated protein